MTFEEFFDDVIVKEKLKDSFRYCWNAAQKENKEAKPSASDNTDITKLLDTMERMLNKSYEYKPEHIYQFMRGKIKQLRNI